MSFFTLHFLSLLFPPLWLPHLVSPVLVSFNVFGPCTLSYSSLKVCSLCFLFIFLPSFPALPRIGLSLVSILFLSYFGLISLSINLICPLSPPPCFNPFSSQLFSYWRFGMCPSRRTRMQKVPFGVANWFHKPSPPQPSPQKLASCHEVHGLQYFGLSTKHWWCSIKFRKTWKLDTNSSLMGDVSPQSYTHIWRWHTEKCVLCALPGHNPYPSVGVEGLKVSIKLIQLIWQSSMATYHPPTGNLWCVAGLTTCADGYVGTMISTQGLI